MSAVPGWTTTRTPLGWTATSWARYWWQPGWVARRARAGLVAGAQRAAGLRGHRRQHRGPGCRARSPHPGDYSQGRQDGHHPARAPHARAIDLAVGERVDGPIFRGPDGQRLDRHGAARVV